MVLQTVSL